MRARLHPRFFSLFLFVFFFVSLFSCSFSLSLLSSISCTAASIPFFALSPYLSAMVSSVDLLRFYVLIWLWFQYFRISTAVRALVLRTNTKYEVHVYFLYHGHHEVPVCLKPLDGTSVWLRWPSFDFCMLVLLARYGCCCLCLVGTPCCKGLYSSITAVCCASILYHLVFFVFATTEHQYTF